MPQLGQKDVSEGAFLLGGKPHRRSTFRGIAPGSTRSMRRMHELSGILPKELAEASSHGASPVAAELVSAGPFSAGDYAAVAQSERDALSNVGDKLQRYSRSPILYPGTHEAECTTNGCIPP